MKEKILAYVKDNRLFVSVIAVLMVIFLLLSMDDLWCRQQHGGGDVLYRCDSFVNLLLQTKFTVSSEASSQSKTEGSKKEKSKVTVDVKGAVANPGVYTLKASARVTDAIKAAGGMTEDADAKSVNLAASLSDEGGCLCGK